MCFHVLRQGHLAHITLRWGPARKHTSRTNHPQPAAPQAILCTFCRRNDCGGLCVWSSGCYFQRGWVLAVRTVAAAGFSKQGLTGDGNAFRGRWYVICPMSVWCVDIPHTYTHIHTRSSQRELVRVPCWVAVVVVCVVLSCRAGTIHHVQTRRTPPFGAVDRLVCWGCAPSGRLSEERVSTVVAALRLRPALSDGPCAVLLPRRTWPVPRATLARLHSTGAAPAS